MEPDQGQDGNGATRHGCRVVVWTGGVVEAGRVERQGVKRVQDAR
jgi:hypothetical protein